MFRHPSWRWEMTMMTLHFTVYRANDFWLNSCNEIVAAVAVAAAGATDVTGCPTPSLRCTCSSLFFLHWPSSLLLLSLPLSLYFPHFPYYVGVSCSRTHTISPSLSFSSSSSFSLWLGIFTSAVEQPKITHTNTLIQTYINIYKHFYNYIFLNFSQKINCAHAFANYSRSTVTVAATATTTCGVTQNIERGEK